MQKESSRHLMLFSHDTMTRQPFTSMAEANQYRRELTAQITTAAQNGDVNALSSLLARYNSLPLLIAALVAQQAQERVQAWQDAQARKEARQAVLRQEESEAWAAYEEVKGRLLPEARERFVMAQQASARAAAGLLRLSELQGGAFAAQRMVTQAQDALTVCVGGPNAGLAQADTVLRLLEEQRLAFETLTREPQPVGEITAPAHLAAA